jgi:hypothetical protein
LDLESSGPFWTCYYRGIIKHAKLPANQPTGPGVGEDSAVVVAVFPLTGVVLVEVIPEGAVLGAVGRLHSTYLYIK